MSAMNSDSTAAASAVSAAVRALAEADFSAVAARFEAAGCSVALPGPGMLQVRLQERLQAGLPAAAKAAPPAVLLSVGVHGDETGPIEVLAHLLDALAAEPQALAVDLMVVVGNLAAIAAGKRFIDADLNRMFRADRGPTGPGTLASAVEAERADALMQASTAFFADAGPQRWHLDLHTAIRPSHYPTFAIVPELIADQAKERLVAWLGNADIGAIIMNPKSAGTFSYFTAEHFGVASSTVELGRVGVLGQNDLSLFADVSAALNGLLRGDPSLIPAAKNAPHVFDVAQEIMKLSTDFKMAFDRSTQNFTVLQSGALIADDGATAYTVQHAEELVVFPNPDVRVGQRAGLMVVRRG
jgi:succinylglutamate desuccinylase